MKMLLSKEAGSIIMKILREHRPIIPQIGDYLADGSPTILCKCSDFDEYNSNGYTDHLTVQVLNALSEADSNAN